MTKLRGVCVAVLVAFFGLCELGLCMQHDNLIQMKVGGDEAPPHDPEIENLGRFAIQEHNNKENAFLEFVKVLKAKEQVVAGKIYYLTLEAIDAGKKKIYEAKIWVKPWMDFKQLEDFKSAYIISSFSSSDLGVKQEVHNLGWHEVAIHDPEVKDAASCAVKSIAVKSNSLSPYELLEIVLAKTKVIKDYVKFNLLLKVSRGINEEKFRVEVNKKLGGKFHVSWMVQDRPLVD